MPPRSRVSTTCAVACVALALGSCQSPPEIHGRVTPREAITLPATAVLEVKVVDVSRPDQAPIIVARRVYTPLGAAPWPFTMRPDTMSTLDPDHGYAVQARVLVDGKPVLVNKRRTYVNPARLADTLNIIVEPVPRTVGVRIGAPVPTAPGLWNPLVRPVTFAAPIPPPFASLAAGSDPVPADEFFSMTKRPECPPSPAL
jgi:putative lipoprotein